MIDKEPEGMTAIVVTYNRIGLLKNCIASLLAQTVPLKRIIIVDNASSDGTEAMLSKNQDPRILYVRLTQNTGGAGGFSTGIQRAIDLYDSWLWLMDDDAVPHSNAAEQLVKIAQDQGNIYGSLAICGSDTSWETTLLDQNRVVTMARDIPQVARVRFIPFLGFLIHRELVNKIGLPDAGYFIAADDVEYCIRAHLAGAQIILSGKSHIEHPKTQQRTLYFLGIKLTYLSLSPWKRYYDTRNRLLIAKQYYGIHLFTKAIPGTMLRLAIALITEPNKLYQLRAFFAGFVDGLRGRKGKRHAKWGIDI